MGRHSAPDDDEADGPGVVTADAAAGSAEAEEADEAAAEAAAAALRGRHLRFEDVETTGPVPGGPVRPAQQRAAAQDEQPTQLLNLHSLFEAAPEAEEAEAAPEPETALGAPEAPAEAEPGPAPEAVAEALTEPTPQLEAGPAPQPEGAAATPRATHATTADLALIRTHPDIRNRVIGAALVPFVLYVAVLLLLSARGVHYLVWVWIPMVTAGVLVGFVLDAGHKRYPGDRTG